jgi:cathepsin B
MRVILAALCVAFAVATPLRDHVLMADYELLNDDDIISSINEQKLGWTAGRNGRFEGLTLRDAKKLLGVRIPESAVSCTHLMESLPVVDMADVPSSFDSRVQWPHYIGSIRDQASCGSCWAFAAAETLSDRLAIASNGSVNVVLSPQVLVSCDTQDMGCSGGWPEYAADFLVSSGIPSDECVPYTSGGGGVEPCPAKCVDGTTPSVHKYDSWSYYIGVNQIMAAVSANGPVAVSMAVYQDFFYYTSGVYKWDKRSGLAGYHAIKLLGYSPDYWIVANSWGTGWGQKGYFLITKGTNECGIELGALDRACPIGGVPHV